MEIRKFLEHRVAQHSDFRTWGMWGREERQHPRWKPEHSLLPSPLASLHGRSLPMATLLHVTFSVDMGFSL